MYKCVVYRVPRKSAENDEKVCTLGTAKNLKRCVPVTWRAFYYVRALDVKNNVLPFVRKLQRMNILLFDDLSYHSNWM